MHIIIKVLIGLGVATFVIAAILAPVLATQLNTSTTSTGNGTFSTSLGSNASTTGLPFFGVQRFFSTSSLPSGWSLCYSATYATNMSSLTLSSIRTSCHKDKLLLGCRTTGSTTLLVAAVGDRYDVLYNCGSSTSCKREANGVAWYYSTSYSWGFAAGNSSVFRSVCDTSSTDPNYRLCWLTNGGGGYRCGSITGLSLSTTYQKVIYHSS